MHRVTLFAVIAICCFNACEGVYDDDVEDNWKKAFAEVVGRVTTTVTEGAKKIETLGQVKRDARILGPIVITVIVLICVIPIILCSCCFFTRCPGYYWCRSRPSNVARGTSGEGKKNPNQINVTVDIPSHQSVIPRRHVPMGQKCAPMPEQYTRKPGPDMWMSQHPPPQYTQNANGQPQS